MLEHAYDGARSYSQSKLARVAFTFELSERRTALVGDRDQWPNERKPIFFTNGF